MVIWRKKKMISKEDWNKLKAQEVYGMYAKLQKQVDSLTAENYELYKKVKELEERLDQHVNTLFESCPHTNF